MEKSKQLFRIGIVALFVLTLYGCDEIFECVLSINPEIHQKQLLIGVVGERYRDEITAEVRNDVNDNDYDYFFDVVGELPPGIFFEVNRRSIDFFGTPEETGNFRFQVELFVERYDYDGFDGSPTCSELAIREFTLQVLE